MMADGYVVGDGSWNLRVYVTDLQVERTLRVKGDLHIGGVMLKLVEDLGKLKFMKNFGSLAKDECLQHFQLHRLPDSSYSHEEERKCDAFVF